MNNNNKVRFYLDKTGFFAESAMIFLVLAAVFRFFGCWGMWTDRVYYTILTLLPILCCLLLTVCILLFGKKGFFLSFIPVFLGVVFFVCKSIWDAGEAGTDWVKPVLCILFYLAAALIYTGTVFGWISTKWLIPPLFGLPFLYRLIMIDIPALSNTANPVSFFAGMQEMSILGMLAAMCCIGLGLRRRSAAKAEEKPQPAPAAVSAPAPAPAPAPAAPAEPAPAEKEPEHQTTVIDSTPEMNAILSDEPYTPVLTLNPEPWEQPAGGEKTDEKRDA